MARGASNQWLKKAVLLSFRLNDMTVIRGRFPATRRGGTRCRQSSTAGATTAFARRLRAVPGAIVRRSAFIAPGVVLMPSFVNLGAYVDSGTMVDTGPRSALARNRQETAIFGGAGIGGVLEPLQAAPVIIEDNCFIGARSEVAEGVIVREGSVLSMGVFIGARPASSTAPAARNFQGEVPSYSVVVPARCQASRCRRHARPNLYLRGDREARGREDTGEDLDSNELLRIDLAGARSVSAAS